MMRRMLAMMLVLLLLLGTAVAYGSSSDEAVFEQALALLKNNYTSAEQLNAAGEVLSGASSTHALSAYLKLYIDALLKLAENDLQGAKDRLLVLNAVDQSELNSMLAQNALPDCEQLDRYIKARELEDDKKLAAANEAYLSLLPLFDTTTRLVALQKSCRDYYDYGKMMAEDGELETAFAVFQNLGDFEDSPEQAAEIGRKLDARSTLSADEV